MTFCLACGSDFFDRTTEENGARLRGNHNVPDKKGVMSTPSDFDRPNSRSLWYWHRPIILPRLGLSGGVSGELNHYERFDVG
jgi:hypothetical protein